jgi:hypothetical protein
VCTVFIVVFIVHGGLNFFLVVKLRREDRAVADVDAPPAVADG